MPFSIPRLRYGVAVMVAVSAVSAGQSLAPTTGRGPWSTAEAVSAPGPSARAEVDDTLRVMTYNVLGPAASVDKPARERWNTRRAQVVATIKAASPDIFGLQEASTSPGEGAAAPWLIASFASSWAVWDPSNGSGTGSPQLIFFDKARFQRTSQGVEVLDHHQCGWNPETKKGQWRTLAWTVLTEKKAPGRSFWVASLHNFSGDSQPCLNARNAAAARIHELIDETNPRRYPTLVMGDLNARPPACWPKDGARLGRSITTLDAATKTHNLRSAVVLDDCSPGTFTADGNWPDYNAKRPGTSRLDYIFRTPGSLDLVATRLIGDEPVTLTSGLRATPSDHFGLLAQFKITT